MHGLLNASWLFVVPCAIGPAVPPTLVMPLHLVLHDPCCSNLKRRKTCSSSAPALFAACRFICAGPAYSFAWSMRRTAWLLTGLQPVCMLSITHKLVQSRLLTSQLVCLMCPPLTPSTIPLLIARPVGQASQPRCTARAGPLPEPSSRLRCPNASPSPHAPGSPYAPARPAPALTFPGRPAGHVAGGRRAFLGQPERCALLLRGQPGLPAAQPVLHRLEPAPGGAAAGSGASGGHQD